MLLSLSHPVQGDVCGGGGGGEGGQSEVLSAMQRGAGGCGVTWELGHCCHRGTWLLRLEVVCMGGGGGRAAHRPPGMGGVVPEAVGLRGLLGFRSPLCYGC